MLRRKGVVGKFVEFFGPGLDDLGLPDRRDYRQYGAQPEYGATWRASSPVDKVALDYLRLFRVATKHRHRAGRGILEGAGHVSASPGLRPTRSFTDTLETGSVDPCSPRWAGPESGRRTALLLKDIATSFKADLTKGAWGARPTTLT